MDLSDAPSLTEPFRLGEIVVRPEERVIERGDMAVHVEPKVMDVLLVLATRAGQVVSRNELFDAVWRGAIVSDEALSRCVYQLRKHLHAGDGQFPLIKTIPKTGYSLTVLPQPLAAGPHHPEPQSEPERIVEGDEPRRWLPPTRWALPAAILVLLVVIAFSMRTPQVPVEQLAPADGEVSRGKLAIAVLPFADLSNDFGASRLAEAFPEDLLIGLGRLGVLQVSAWASSRRFELGSVCASQAGEALGVDLLLTGTIRIEGNEIRVWAELLDADNSAQLWAGAYEQRLDNLHDIQNEIAHAVMRVMDVRIDSFEIAPVSSSLTAYELYVEGRHYMNRRNAGALQQAIEFFELAIAADPDFAEALSGLADAYMIATQYQRTSLPAAIDRAQPLIDRAIVLNPNLAEPIASQGLLYLQAGDYARAADTLRRAAAMNSNYASAHNWLGRAVELQGHYAQALEAYRRGLRLDPLSTILNMNEARMLASTGNDVLADRRLNRLLELDPDFPNTYWALGFNSYVRGELVSSIERFHLAFEKGLLSPFAMADFATVLAFAGDYAAARDWLQRSQSMVDFGQTHLPGKRLAILRGAIDGWLMQEQEHLSQAPDDVAHLYAAAQAAMYQGDHDAAAGLCERGQGLDVDDAQLLSWTDAVDGGLIALDCVLAFQRGGATDAANDLLERVAALTTRLKASGAALPTFKYTLAAEHALVGDDSAAIDALHEVAASGWPGIRLAAVDPKFARLRERAAVSTLLEGAPNGGSARDEDTP